MDISNYNIEQCDAVSVLNAILDVYDKPTAKQVTLQEGISQILAAIPNTSGLATESNATANKNAIIAAMPSTSGLATSSDVSTAQSSIEGKIGTPASGQPTDLFAAIAAGGGGDAQESTSLSILSKVQSIIDNSTVQLNYDGITYVQGHEPASVFDLINNSYKSYVMQVVDDDATYLPSMSKNDYSSLEVFVMRNAINGFNSKLSSWMESSQTLKKVVLPNIKATDGSVAYFLRGMPLLEFVDLTNANYNNFALTFQSCPKLIDIVTGKGFTTSRNLLSTWNPDEAKLETSSSLVTGTEKDEHGNPLNFSNNREKLLYNIREHIAKNLSSSITATIYFSADILSIIQNDADTLAAFPVSWTLAS